MNEMHENAVVSAGLFGFIGVGMGAFGAHAMAADLVNQRSVECVSNGIAVLFGSCRRFARRWSIATAQSRASMFFIPSSDMVFFIGILFFSGSLWVWLFLNSDPLAWLHLLVGSYCWRVG